MNLRQKKILNIICNPLKTYVNTYFKAIVFGRRGEITKYQLSKGFGICAGLIVLKRKR